MQTTNDGNCKQPAEEPIWDSQKVQKQNQPTNPKERKTKMSCCYFADMGVKFKTEAGKALATEALANYLKAGFDRGGRQFDAGIEAFAKQGITTDTFEGCIDIVLAGWEGQKVLHGIYKNDGSNDLNPTDENGYYVYSNGFDARYGWLTIMVESFRIIAEYLVDGSYFEVDYDNEYSKFIVKDGKAPEVESGVREEEDEEEEEEENG